MQLIRQKKYDMVINLTEGDRGAIIAWISGARIRVGMDPQDSGFKGKKKCYTHLIKHYGAPRHTVEKNLDALRRIGIFPKEEERKLFFHVTENADKSMQMLLAEKNIAVGSYLLIHPTSRWLYKSWPSANFHRLVLELLEKKIPVILCGSGEGMEKKFVEAIKQGISSPLLCDFSGKTTLKEMGALIEMSRSLLCVDSVSLHIASALQAKTVALFGPTSEILWGPWQNPCARVLSQPYSCRPCCLDGCAGAKMADCLFTLPVEKVLQAIEEMIL
jgi:heptosyltransferase-3